MKYALVLLGIVVSLSCFSQTLSREEQNKVYNTIRDIKSEHQGVIPTKPQSNNATIRLSCTPSSIDTTKLPLVVVDGVPQEYSFLQTLDLKQIESITILKGDKISIGCRPLNGVILITLKCKKVEIPVL